MSDNVPDRIHLAPGERAAWNRIAGPRWSLVGGVVLIGVGVVGGVLSDTGWFWYGAPLGAMMVLMGTMRVSVSDDGVTVAPAVLPILRRHIALSKIRSATGRHASLVELGGWGPYRISPGRHSVALRPGDSLWLELNSGREFVVTVDDAAGAAALVNALLRRHQEQR